VDSNNKVVNVATYVAQIADAMAQRGIDFAANFWNYWNFFGVTPPSWFQDIQRTMITAATSIFQPDLINHELFYNSELALGHTLIVVAHSQGNLYVNQAYPVVTALGGGQRFNIVGVATPAPSVAGSGPYFTLVGDVITSVPGSLPPDTINGPPSPCPSSPFSSGSVACHSFDDSYMVGNATRPAITNAVTSKTAVAPTTPGIQWLSFVEGNPGFPGDGQFVVAGPNTYFGGVEAIYFEPIPAVSFGGMMNGFTLTLFPPAGVTLQSITYDVLAIHPPLGCPVTGWGTGIGGSFGLVTVNGVQGFVLSVAQSDVQGQLTLLNQYLSQHYVGCQYGLADMYLGIIYLNLGVMTRLDALAFAFGQGVVP